MSEDRHLSTGAAVKSIREHSVAHRLGLLPGDQILAINGHRLHDVIDYRFYQAEDELELVVRRGDQLQAFHLHKATDEDLGLGFFSPTFDGIRRCRNDCPFCFLSGMPRGLRPSLYVKDDDYRYSFLFGNFITLTNLTEADWRRLEEQRLSPLYVSVHATEPELRSQLLGCRRAPDILEQIRRLGTLRIRIHAQIVVTPGLNDGAHLARTVADLSDLHPTVQSIGIVPVGLTRHRPVTCLPLRTMSSSEARAIVAETRKWQGQFRRRFGTRLVWASDEIYLLAGARIPGARAYEGFPQLENGVGLVCSLLVDWQRIKRQGLRPGRVTPSPQGPNPVTVVTGTLAAPVLAPALAELQSLLDERGKATRFRLLPVANRFFGETVTVAGLLTARDVLEALKGQHLGQAVFLPRAMFDSAGQVTLDDASLRDFREALGVEVHYASQLSQIVQVLCQAPS